MIPQISGKEIIIVKLHIVAIAVALQSNSTPNDINDIPTGNNNKTKTIVRIKSSNGKKKKHSKPKVIPKIYRIIRT